MIFEQRCSKCGKYKYYAGEFQSICTCNIIDVNNNDDLRKLSVDLSELVIEARQVARKLYKRLCDEHIALISQEICGNYWIPKGMQFTRILKTLNNAHNEIEFLREENRKLRQLLSEVEFCEGVYEECFWCEGNKRDGHMLHCPRQKALKDEINHGQ